ncbi:TRAP transporter small permease [Halalkalibacter krulwichiae]|uniref:Tripartite ATP-independent periplasmic transporters, DctQ component n=1 Tax=Halalkalibacter krulwichiae TaxID=199441 RepID=A0A1X9MBB4_9BACI|nr:TRAP transporter small permease subunit [Halalkalibacter krulwichiae]ARK29934.1 Tripartite ATP-independent periplasmic transporters, DctQ component [Halalkalibacter krulwichiae]
MEHNGQKVKKIQSSFAGVLDNVSETLGKIGGLAILLMVILVTFNVISRKIFNWSMPGFYEILGLIGAVFYSFGIVYGATKGQHIVMDMVVNRLPKNWRKICEMLTRIIILAFCGLLAYAGIDVTLGMLEERTYDIKIPVAPFRFVVVTVFVLLALLILAGKNISKGGEEE